MKYILGLLLILSAQTIFFAQTGDPVKLKTGTIFLQKNRESIDQLDLSFYTYNDSVYGIVQFDKIPDRLQKEFIQGAGLMLIEYLSGYAYLAKFNKIDVKKIMLLETLKSFSGLHPNLKISPGLINEISKSEKHDKHQINVKLFPNKDSKIFISDLKEIGIFLKQEINNPEILRAIATAKDIKELARHPLVCFIEKPSAPGEKEDIGARVLHRSNNIDQSFKNGLAFDGTGITVLVRDDGKIGPHIDYKGRTNQEKAKGDSNFANHGDMVSGILMGAGNLNPDVTGTAKGAFLYLTDYEATFLDETMDLYKTKNVSITSSSYSDGCNDGYTLSSMTTDKQIFENKDLIHVFSAGNSGNSDCGYGAGAGWGNITGGHKMGKNSIAVGNLNQDGVIENSSSRGPASDGRIKPDICANGAGQLSTYPNNTIDFGGGTSAAAPGVSGVLAQLNQAYRSLNNGEIPPSALLKAALLNSANDLGQTGPDFIFGWGQVNARKAFEILKTGNYQKFEIEQGLTKEFNLNIPENISNLKVMIYWADKENSILSGSSLVNDIDITILPPNGTELLPYLLNPTADAALLSSPATTGADHLNNMEQIEVSNPQSGNYKITLSGFSIPFDNAEVWLVYELQSNKPFLVFPNGGESFNTNENVKIQWDATNSVGNFNLDYSNDQGKTWNFIKTVNGNQRKTTWTTPNIPLDSVQLRIVQNGLEHTTEAPFIILNSIDSLTIDNICPQSASIHWNQIEGASKYVLFELGEKYMTPFDTVNITNATFANYPGIDRWVSVMPLSVSGMPGKRSIAIKLHKLLNCPQSIDLAVKIDSMLPLSKIFCEENTQPLTAIIANEGIDTIKTFNLFYKIANNPINQKFISTVIPSGSEITIPFDSILVNTSSNLNILVWVEANGESANYNDTLNFSLSYQVQNPNGTETPYTQSFEQTNFPPNFWTLQTNDSQVNWDTLTCTGAYGKPTVAAWMNNFNNLIEGSFDDLITEKFNLTNETNAYLQFDYAYTRFDQDYNDSLKISVSFDCGVNFEEHIFYKGGESLKTTDDMEITFIPSTASQWKSEIIDLKDFLGKVLTFRFRNISGYGNSLLIDNIRIVKKLSPEAYIFDTASTYCIGITNSIEFTAKLSPIGNYQWNFGQGAIPNEANGPGPHLVSYNTPGNKIIQLIVDTGLEADTAFTNLLVSPITDAKFNYNKNGKIIDFMPLQQGINTKHEWNFGDGEFSQEINPTHIYAAGGNYNVLHLITDDCSVDEHNEIIILTSTTESETVRPVIFPNPADEYIEIFTTENYEFISLQNIVGIQQKLILTKSLKGYHLKVEDILPGLYFLTLQLNGQTSVFKLEILRN